jgi:hypothetical protein
MTDRSAEAEYEYGIALAHVGRWQEARASLMSGQKKAPLDKRFPTELAGVAFHDHSNAEAKSHLRRALTLDPRDSYANDFLATLYFLDGNLEAALKYWNRAGKPALVNVAADPQPQLDPTLLNRVFVFAPGTTLTEEKYYGTRQRIEMLHILPSYRFELISRDDGHFDLVLHASERNGFGDSKLERLINLFGRLPFQTITPEFYNINHSGANFVSLYRFDPQKRRLFASYTAPIGGDPKWRYATDVDLRQENWDLTSTTSPGAVAPNFVFKKAEADVRIESIVTPNLHWTSAVQVADRRFPQFNPGSVTGENATLAADLLGNGPTLKYTNELNRTLLRLAERRFVSTGDTRLDIGRFWTASAHSFAKVAAGIRMQWLPQASEDDYSLSTQFRGGKSFGSLPFDELYMLGIERDSDLWLRAHPGTRDGNKGSAPMGRGYLLSNTDWDKNVFNGGFLQIKMGLFFDAGRVHAPSPVLGSSQWLLDTGAQVKLHVLGCLGVVLTYGRDVRGGRNTFYASNGR